MDPSDEEMRGIRAAADIDIPDMPLEELISMWSPTVKEGGLVFLTWICPKCGDRARALQPNYYATKGYVHANCGGVYTGELFGCEPTQPVHGQTSSLLNLLKN